MWIPKGKPKPTWRDLPIAGIITEPGNSVEYLTGDWRALRPVKDSSKCNNCGLCWVFCPEGAIVRVGEGYEIDYRYCKGCGICARECKRGAIQMVPEGE